MRACVGVDVCVCVWCLLVCMCVRVHACVSVCAYVSVCIHVVCAQVSTLHEMQSVGVYACMTEHVA